MTGGTARIIDATIDDLARYRNDLAELLQLCVAEGPALGYQAPLSLARAHDILDDLTQTVATGGTRLLLALHGEIAIGTIAIMDDRETEPHLGQIARLMVHPAHRRRNIATGLLAAAESTAVAAGKTRLYLFTGDEGIAGPLYANNGYTICGRIPEGGMRADRTPIDALIFTKALSRSEP